MRLFMQLLVFGCFSVLISSRPTSTLEGNESETSDAEEEDSEDAEEDEYLSDGQESAKDEALNQDGVIENSQEQNLNIRNNKDNIDYRTFSEIGSDNKKEQDLNKLINSNLLREKSQSVEIERPNTYNDESNNAAEPNEESVLKRNDHQRLESRNVNSGSISADYSDAAGGDNINERLNPNKQPNSMQQYYKMQSKNRNLIDGRRYDYLGNSRDRRNAHSFKSEKNTEDSNENTENAVLKNIKKLSDQDLEELLDSLPEDKKDLLRKIMDKREITKKAGAVDDNNGLEQADTSKVEEHYSEDSNTNSGFSSNTDASEAKQSNGEETSTKTSENDQVSGKSENKIGFDPNGNVEALEVNIEAVTSNVGTKKQDAKIVSKETNKNDNKREINTDLKGKNILQDAEAKFDDDLNGKNTYDFALDQTAIDADNSDLFEPKNEASNAQKREVSQLESETLSDSMKSLEDSFPSGITYEDMESGMEPLIRVKRTKLEHRVEKRDLPQLNDKVPFVTGYEELENIEGNEFKDNNFSEHSPMNQIIQKNNKGVETNEHQNLDKQQRFCTNINKNSKLHDVEDKSSLGSDTDNILSSIEGIDENIMYINKARNKRLMKENNSVKLTRNGRTIGPITNNDNNSLTDNCFNGHQYESQEPFGAVLQNSEEDLTRFKRI